MHSTSPWYYRKDNLIMKYNSFRKPQINHTDRTITISAAFQRAATEYNTDAFKSLMEIRKDCPSYKVVCASPRKPTKQKSKITFARMEHYISCLRGGTEYLEIFEKVKDFAKSQPNHYLTVSRWFNECFPDYGCQPEFDADGYPIVEVNLISYEKYKAEQEASIEQQRSKKEQISATSQQEQSENE